MTERTFGRKADIPYTELRGAYLVAMERGAIHVISQNGTIRLPGGICADGVSHEVTILGACLDETGWDVSVDDFITDADLYDDSAKAHLTATYYSGAFLESLTEKSSSDARHEQLSLSELDRLTNPMEQWAVQQCIEMLRADAHGSDDEDL